MIGGRSREWVILEKELRGRPARSSSAPTTAATGARASSPTALDEVCREAEASTRCIAVGPVPMMRACAGGHPALRRQDRPSPSTRSWWTARGCAAGAASASAAPASTRASTGRSSTVTWSTSTRSATGSPRTASSSRRPLPAVSPARRPGCPRSPRASRPCPASRPCRRTHPDQAAHGDRAARRCPSADAEARSRHLRRGQPRLRRPDRRCWRRSAACCASKPHVRQGLPGRCRHPRVHRPRRRGRPRRGRRASCMAATRCPASPAGSARRRPSARASARAGRPCAASPASRWPSATWSGSSPTGPRRTSPGPPEPAPPTGAPGRRRRIRARRD